jgi:UPF0755 protein
MTDPRLEDSIFGGESQPGEGPADGTDDPGHAVADDRDDGFRPDAEAAPVEDDPESVTGGAPRRRRRWIAILVALALVVAGGVVAVQAIRPIVDSITHRAPDDYAGEGTGQVSIVIKPGESGSQIANTLQRAGVIKSVDSFNDEAAAEPEFASIAPGTYQLKKHMSAKSALTLLLDPSSRAVTKVTLPEGMWKCEIFAKLSKQTGVPLSDYKKVTPVSAGLPKQAKGNFEGYLFPATYSFSPGTPATQQVRTMVTKAVSELKELDIQPADYQRTLTIASIVEGEAKAKTDRPKVARVILNRVQAGMKLQMDSTVHYIAQRRGAAGTSDKERNSKSRYNTYRYKGLPPGPINNPGAASIEAAAHPAKGKWLYFVAVNPVTGETRFAETYAEQQHNEELFHQWCRAHKSQC